MPRRSRSRSPTRPYHSRSENDGRRREGHVKREDGDYYDSRRRDRRDDEDNHYRSHRRDDYPKRGEGSSRAPERRDDRDRNYDRKRDRSPRPRSRSPRSAPRPAPSHRSASPRSRPRSHSKSVAPEEDAEDKAKPNFKPSGLLAAETKKVEHADGTSTVLKYHEPPEARKPVVGWRLYVFKGKEQVDLLHISRQSAYLIGRDRTVADIAIDHPSCSKQHAAIQFRQVLEKNEFGDSKAVIKPFIIDLESTNSTHVNDEAIPVSRYYELMPGDVIKFGESAREYVILHDEAT